MVCKRFIAREQTRLVGTVGWLLVETVLTLHEWGVAGLGVATGTGEVAGNIRVPVIVKVLLVVVFLLDGGLALLRDLPLVTHLLNTLLVVELWVVWLADTPEAFPEGQMPWVDGNTVVISLATGTDESPATLLLLKIETSGVWHKEEGQESTSKTEPWDNVETFLSVDVVEENSSNQSTELTTGSTETVSGGTDWGWENLGSDEESDTVWSKLVEETREEVHGLERVDTSSGVVVVVESWDDEGEEVTEETNVHHQDTAVKLVVDEERGEVVTDKLNTDVEQVPEPTDDNGLVVWRKNTDKLGLEELVAVEENVVTEPGTSGGDKTESKVLDAHLERSNIVTSDVRLLLGKSELLGGRAHLVGAVVNQPESTDSWDGERNTKSPLRGDLGVWWVTGTVVEDEEEKDQDDLVEELTPTLHQESGNDLATTVHTVIAG